MTERSRERWESMSDEERLRREERVSRLRCSERRSAWTRLRVGAAVRRSDLRSGGGAKLFAELFNGRTSLNEQQLEAIKAMRDGISTLIEISADGTKIKKVTF